MDEPVMYGFGPYRFDARDGVLTRAGEPVPLTPKAPISYACYSSPKARP